MRPTFPRNLVAGCAVAAALSTAGWGAFPTAWEMSSWQDFIRGRFEGLSLSRDGRIGLAPSLTSIFQAGQPMIWSVTGKAGGDIYLGTGHQGKVYRVSQSGAGELLWTAPEPEVFTLAVDRQGRLYAGTSPNGKIYVIENGKAADYFAPGASYIWALVFGADGALYAGTGVEGKIYRVTGAGKGEVWYETGQSHVTSLAFDEAGQLLAGTEPNGILYRITAKDKAFSLHDAGLPEIRSIVPGSGGVIYAAAMGGSVARQTGAAKPAAAAAAPVVSATITSVTITDSATQGGVEIKPQPAVQPAVQPAPTGAAVPAVEYAGIEKSALYRIAPDNSVETLWSSKEENAYDLLSSKEGLVFTTDAQGRIYRLGPDRLVTLLAETRESEALRLLALGDALLIATGNEGRLFRLGPGLGAAGTYESPVQDAGKVARWGRFSWRAESCENCRLALRVRAGNSPRPDKTWSDWSPPLADSGGSAVSAPNARYVQWKAEFSGSSGRSPQLRGVRLAYLPQNAAPELKSITISSQSSPAAAKPSAQPAAATYSITVTDTGEAGASSLTGTPTQPVNRAAAEQLVVTWVTEDADGDRLTSVLEYRGAEEREWKLIKEDLTQNTYTIDADAFADGYYYFRVTASDRAGNPPADAREATLVSPPVLIDRTPPWFKLGRPQRTKTSLTIPFEVSDAASPLTRCEASLDGGAWLAQAPADGILDSPSESFQLRLEPPPAPGKEHVLVLRCADSASNPGLARILLP